MKRHECFKQVDEQLKEYNTRLSTNMFDNNDLIIGTEVIHTAQRGRAKVVIASFCPFCGKKIVRKKNVLS